MCILLAQVLRQVLFSFEPTSSLVSIFTIKTRGSQEPLSLTWTMFLRLSHRPLYYTMFRVCRHLGSDPDLPDTILKGDHPRTSVTKFDSSWLFGFREEYLWMCFSRGYYVNLGYPWGSCWFRPRPTRHNFERGPSTDHCDQVWFHLTQ
jgi:hypothetical protein